MFLLNPIFNKKIIKDWREINLFSRRTWFCFVSIASIISYLSCDLLRPPGWEPGLQHRLLIPPGVSSVSLYVLDHEGISDAAWTWMCPHMWTGQELLHDVAVVNLPAAAQPLLLRVQLLVVLNLKQTHEVSLTPQQNNAKRFLGGLNLNERDYRPNLSPIPWCRIIPKTHGTL